MKNVVYFISDGEFLKIGIASDLDRRLTQLQTGNARELTVVSVIECRDMDEARSLEGFLHDRLARLNVLNEWFLFDRKAIVAAVHSAGYRMNYMAPVADKMSRRFREIVWRSVAVNLTKEIAEICGAMILGAFLTEVPVVGDVLQFLAHNAVAFGIAIGVVGVIMLLDSARRRRV